MGGLLLRWVEWSGRRERGGGSDGDGDRDGRERRRVRVPWAQVIYLSDVAMGFRRMVWLVGFLVSAWVAL